MDNLITLEETNRIHDLCKKYKITKYTINNDGSIDVDNYVYFSSGVLPKLPLKFNKVIGYFDCTNNKLTTLEGSPKEVGGYYDCSNNMLDNLMDGPIMVGGNFYCDRNNLTTLNGCPKEIGGDFNCKNNLLTTLMGCYFKLEGSFFASYNQLPDEFNRAYNRLYREQKPIFLKYQNYYDVWTPDFNEDNMETLINDINDGLE